MVYCSSDTVTDNSNIFKKIEYSVEGFGRDYHLNDSAEGEFAENSQAKGPNPDETLESKWAPKK